MTKKIIPPKLIKIANKIEGYNLPLRTKHEDEATPSSFILLLKVKNILIKLFTFKVISDIILL